MTWLDYVSGLRPEERDRILYELLSWQLDDCGVDAEIGFSDGEDPEYQGTYTVNAQIYWVANGNDLLR